MADAFQYDVFLSHSSKDKPVVRELAERLRNGGLKVWFDEWVIKPGDSIPSKIDEGLENSRVLVLCMSANAFGSDWPQLESQTFRFRDPLNKEQVKGQSQSGCLNRRNATRIVPSPRSKYGTTKTGDGLLLLEAAASL